MSVLSFWLFHTGPPVSSSNLWICFQAIHLTIVCIYWTTQALSDGSYFLLNNLALQSGPWHLLRNSHGKPLARKEWTFCPSFFGVEKNDNTRSWSQKKTVFPGLEVWSHTLISFSWSRSMKQFDTRPNFSFNFKETNPRIDISELRKIHFITFQLWTFRSGSSLFFFFYSHHASRLHEMYKYSLEWSV